MPLIELKNVSYQIKNKSLLHNINLSIHQGEIVGLVGPNGAGKTSLLNIIANLNKNYSGHYHYNGDAINNIDRKSFAKELAYLEQGAPVHWPLIAKRVIELGRLPYQGLSDKLTAQDILAVNKAIELAECEAFLDQPVNTLSGGERLRVLLARLFASEPNVILADEPTAALDPYHQLHTMEILQQHAHTGGAVIVVLHDINLAARFCDRLVVINQGEITANDTVDNILEQGILEQVYNIDLLATAINGQRIIAATNRR